MASSLIFNSKGQGPALVFIHGWGLNSGVWQPTVEQLSLNYQVITIDLPGFGLNVEESVSPYSLVQISKLISDSIDIPAIYIGWSLGGLVATQIALDYPEKVQGLVTIASSPCFVEKRFVEKNTAVNEAVTNTPNIWQGIKPQVLQAFRQQLNQDIKKTLEGFLKIQALGSPSIRQDIKQLRDFILQYPMPSKTTLEQSLQLLTSEDLRTQLINIKMPFLRLYGKLDSLVPKAVIEPINTLAPQSDHYIFNKASHAPFISHFNDFILQLTLWLTKYY
jgi:pimeloyl-[acyl-carrier protein] methyl ester esterase